MHAARRRTAERRHEAMKLPKYFIGTVQQAVDLHLNGFALQLMAESFGDKPELFGDENVVLLAHAHNSQPVWFVMTKTQPQAADFGQDDLIAQQKELIDRLTGAVLNQCGDNLCWLEGTVGEQAGRILPEAEFLESCRRYRQQIAETKGEVTDPRRMTIAQLEARCVRIE